MTPVPAMSLFQAVEGLEHIYVQCLLADCTLLIARSCLNLA